MSDLGCPARIYHGPGHQSSTKCELPIGHDDGHYCIYGEFQQEAEWFGGFPGEEPLVFTGFADEPPVFPEITGSESLAGVTLEEKWYKLHEDWRPRLVPKCDCAFDVSWEHNSNCPKYDGPRTGATPTEVTTDEAADFFAGISEETARALLTTIPPRMLTDIYHGWRNSSAAPEWFAQVAHEVIVTIVKEATLSHGTIEANHIDKLWAAVDEYLHDELDTYTNDVVSLTVERNHARRKLQELRDIIEEKT